MLISERNVIKENHHFKISQASISRNPILHLWHSSHFALPLTKFLSAPLNKDGFWIIYKQYIFMNILEVNWPLYWCRAVKVSVFREEEWGNFELWFFRCLLEGLDLPVILYELRRFRSCSSLALLFKTVLNPGLDWPLCHRTVEQ